MKGLEKLKKRSLPDLRKIAKKSGIKVAMNWGRTKLATKILEKQKLDELKDEQVQPEPESDEIKRKPDFETLATESPEIAPDSPQVEEQGPGGVREGAGRPPGITDEKARVQRILKNQVPDPAVQFVVECIFGLSGEPKKAVEPTTDMIAVPATNLISYYFPNLNLSPLLQVWFDLGIGVKNLVVSRVQAMKVKAAAQQESPESAEPIINDMDPKI
ncbi:hypothetical protein ES702_07360 [subsurface metagenome]